MVMEILLWRYGLWRRFISQKYELQNSWTIEEVTDTFGCSVWKTTSRLWPSFNNNLKYRVRNGGKTCFWNELWIGKRIWGLLFQTLHLELAIDGYGTQGWRPQGWNLIFMRALNDWEVNRVAELLQILNAFPGVILVLICQIQKLHNKRFFTVKSCYWNSNFNLKRQQNGPGNCFGRLKYQIRSHASSGWWSGETV